jgi:hypothetical protein
MIIWRQRIARGLLFGAIAFAVQACDFIQGVRQTRSLNRIGPAEEAAYAAFRAGRQPEASKALLELATILQREETDWSGTSHGKGIAFDLCLTYGRLGLLAVGTQQEVIYFEQARPWCDKSGQTSVRDSSALRDTLGRVDKSAARKQPEAP